MRHPPEGVAVVARHHWLMGGAIAFFLLVLLLLVRSAPQIQPTRATYTISLGLALLYLGTGTLVWFGTPLGRVLNFVCSLVYLARPQMGLRLWRISDSAEFKAHFARPKAINKSREDNH